MLRSFSSTARWPAMVALTPAMVSRSRMAPHQAFQQGLLAGAATARDRPEDGAAGARGDRDDPQLRE